MNPHFAKCKGCGADIVWLKTFKGKNMLVEAARENIYRAYTSAIISLDIACPFADKFRKSKRRVKPKDEGGLFG